MEFWILLIIGGCLVASKSMYESGTIHLIELRKRKKFIDYISRIEPNPIDTLNSKIKKMIIENKKYRMLKRREMKKRLKYS